MEIVLIAAMTENHVIGKDNKIPWDIPAEQEMFKAFTMGNPIIMGRKTFESFEQPLPGREHIVLSGTEQSHESNDVTFVNSIDEALDAVPQDTEQVFVIGGQSIYEQFMVRADKMILSVVDREVDDGDSFFPVFQDKMWESHGRSGGDGFTTTTYTRKE